MWRALKPERVVLVVGLLAGTITVFLRPAFTGADEEQHFFRAYQLSEGTVIGERVGSLSGGYLPTTLNSIRSTSLVPEPERQQRSWRPRRGDRIFRDFRNTVLYAPVPYLPQTLAIRLARFLEVSPPSLLLIGRLAGLVTGFAMIWLAVRITPVGKWLFALLALTPQAMQQYNTLTADTITNAASALLVAMFVRVALDPAARLRGARLVGLALCALVVTLSKQTYFPLLLLFFLAPVARAGTWRRYAAVFGTIAGTCLLALVLWSLAISDLYLPKRQELTANPSEQSARILSDPVGHALFLAGDLSHRWDRRLAGSFGYAGNMPTIPLALLHTAMLALIALFEPGARKFLSLRSKAVLLAVFVLSVAAVDTAAFLVWNPVGSDVIQGSLGRYYVPFLSLPFLLLSNRRLGALVPERRFTLAATAIAVACAIPTIPVWHIG